MAWLQGTTSTATCATTGSAWYAWTDGTCTTATAPCRTTTSAGAAAVWTAWNGACTGTDGNGYFYAPAPVQRTAEEQAAHEAAARERAEAAARERAEAAACERAEAARIKAEQAQKEKAAADKRAEELLLQHLDKGQRRSYRTRKRFKVIGGDGACFEIGQGWSGNVREFGKDGKPVARFCIHPREAIPEPDLMLAQMLLLRCDVEQFRKIANRTAIPAGA